jgi:hypothetical protein
MIIANSYFFLAHSIVPERCAEDRFPHHDLGINHVLCPGLELWKRVTSKYRPLPRRPPYVRLSFLI